MANVAATPIEPSETLAMVPRHAEHEGGGKLESCSSFIRRYMRSYSRWTKTGNNDL